MKLEISVHSLIVEVTRRCNMLCGHCMRGDAEKADLSDEVLTSIFSQGLVPSSITPSGGEPFLVPDITGKVLREALNAGASDFFISTNGTISPFSKKGFKIMNAIEAFITTGADEISSIRVSRDRFHSDINENPWRLIAIADVHDSVGKYVVSRGRADSTGVGTIYHDYSTLYYEAVMEDDDLLSIRLDTLYVNVYGEVFADGDLSYENQDEFPEELGERVYLGNIANIRDTITKIVREDHPYYFEDEDTVAA